ncbi:MAG: ABC-2 type transport system ATP-binding protein [Granulosicoccus sp.]|jgi:ABC-2 type transport system ATP-binding protein
MNALSIAGLSKTYGDSVHALKGIDLCVPEGDFFALLGPNGAGKSTAIGIVSSLVNKTAGTVRVFDHDIDSEPEAAKASIGLVPQEFNFNVFEPVLPTLLNVAGYNGINRTEALKRAEYYLKKLDLWDKRHAPSRQLSGGMKRRLMIARALIHEPRLLILDEPTAGVDLEIRRSMWAFLKELNEQHGTTIILTTHYLEEAEALCRNVAIIDGGQIIEHGAVAQLLSRSMLETFVLDTLGHPDALPDLASFTARYRDGNRIEVDVPKGHTLNELFEQLSLAGIEVTSLRNKTNRLEEFFLRLVHRKTEESV